MKAKTYIFSPKVRKELKELYDIKELEPINKTYYGKDSCRCKFFEEGILIMPTIDGTGNNFLLTWREIFKHIVDVEKIEEKEVDYRPAKKLVRLKYKERKEEE